jgi:hypothetical protein
LWFGSSITDEYELARKVLGRCPVVVKKARGAARDLVHQNKSLIRERVPRGGETRGVVVGDGLRFVKVSS